MPQGDDRSPAPPPEPEYEEITLADIVRVLHRRKMVLGVTLVLALLAGAAVTVFTPPAYEATATIIPLEQSDIIENWLGSRHAAELVAVDLGGRLNQTLFPDRWDESTQTWQGTPPTLVERGAALRENVEVDRASSVRGSAERLITVTVTLEDPLLARDVANAYVGTLSSLRPHLENITRQEAFDKYYDGQNEQQAQQRAEVAARQKEYWLGLDDAGTPEDPVRPKPTLNMALAGVLGLMLGVFAVFFVEWLSKYRAETAALDVPESPNEGERGGGEDVRWTTR